MLVIHHKLYEIAIPVSIHSETVSHLWTLNSWNTGYLAAIATIARRIFRLVNPIDLSLINYQRLPVCLHPINLERRDRSEGTGLHSCTLDPVGDVKFVEVAF